MSKIACLLSLLYCSFSLQVYTQALPVATIDEVAWSAGQPWQSAAWLLLEINQVVMHGYKRVRSYDVRDCRLIWECGGQAFNPVASPITSISPEEAVTDS